MAGYKKNLKNLEEHLDQDETVQFSCFGLYDTTSLGAETWRNGVLAATNKRVIFFAKKLFGFDLETFPLSKISAIEFSKGFWGKKMNLTMSGNTAKLKMINHGDPEELVNYVRENMGEKKSSVPTLEDIPSQISKLSELKDKGVITEEEFISKKTELLNKM